MTPTLHDAEEKLRWAKEHFESLRPAIEAFQESHDYRISVDIDADTGQYVFHVHGLQEVDTDWGLRIGDCLHNARAALDYVMVRLYALITGTEPRDVTGIQFPIFPTPERFISS